MPALRRTINTSSPAPSRTKSTVDAGKGAGFASDMGVASGHLFFRILAEFEKIARSDFGQPSARSAIPSA
jgi:hypothetical protein